MASRDLLRASDRDREQVVERLRAAAGEGRLRVGELEQRLASAFDARTYGELDALVADLPAVLRPSAPARRRPGLPILAGATLALGLLLSALAAAATSGYARFNAAVDAAAGPGAHGRPYDFYDAGPTGLLGAMAPLVVIVFLVTVCAALGWLFSQDSDGATSPPEA